MIKVEDNYKKLMDTLTNDEDRKELLNKILHNLIWCDEILLKELVEKWCQ